MSDSKIKMIIMKEGAYIGIIGAIWGIFLSFIMIYLQNRFHIIQLSKDIYFMDYLPVDPSLLYFIIYPVTAFIITVAFAYYPANRASKISPADALRYE